MLGLTDRDLQIVVEVLSRMGVGVLLAGAIGWEREIHGRPAGIRTHMLLMMGVILFCSAGRFFPMSESSRVAAQVVVGIGFLGAGSILRSGADIKGLTTAASIWATAGIGMAVSLGGAFEVIAVIATILALATLVGVDTLEHRYLHTKRSQALRLRLDAKQEVFVLIQHLTAKHNLQIRSVSIIESSPEIVVEIEVRGETQGLLESVLALPGVLAASLQTP